MTCLSLCSAIMGKVGVLAITEDGSIKIFDGKKKEIWSTNMEISLAFLSKY